MLQQFLRTASDGWDLALTSVRNLFAEADLHADEVGGDFAGEAARLGEALAEVHALLAEHFPTAERTAGEMAALGAAMSQRLDTAVAIVPELAPYAPALRAVFDAVGTLDGITVQQVHGDLHLGQTLRTVKGWKIVDFEGEPAKPLAERVKPDSAWRDVAGMLRSFDYAPRVAAQPVGRQRRRARPARVPRRRVVRAQLRRLPRRVRRPRADRRPSRPCSTPTRSTRRSTKSSTRPATDPSGSLSRWQPSSGSRRGTRHDQHVRWGTPTIKPVDPRSSTCWSRGGTATRTRSSAPTPTTAA